MVKSSLGLVLLSVLLVAGPPSLAQQGPSGNEIAGLSVEIEKLNRSLDDIARSLRELLHDQKIQVVIRRIELEERRQAPLGSELRSARSTVRSEQEELDQIQGMMERVREMIDEAVREGMDPQTVPQRTELRELETILGLVEQRLDSAEARVIDLENDVARGRDRIAILDEQLQELLDESE